MPSNVRSSLARDADLYREYEEECQAIARRAKDHAHKERLAGMADTWNSLARAERTDMAEKRLTQTSSQDPGMRVATGSYENPNQLGHYADK